MRRGEVTRRRVAFGAAAVSLECGRESPLSRASLCLHLSFIQLYYSRPASVVFHPHHDHEQKLHGPNCDHTVVDIHLALERRPTQTHHVAMSSLFDSLNFPSSSQQRSSQSSQQDQPYEQQHQRASRPSVSPTKRSRDRGPRVFWHAPPSQSLPSLGHNDETSQAGPSRLPAVPPSANASTLQDQLLQHRSRASSSSSSASVASTSTTSSLRPLHRRSKLTRPPPRRFSAAAASGPLRRHASSSAAFAHHSQQQQQHHPDLDAFAPPLGKRADSNGTGAGEGRVQRLLEDLTLQLQQQDEEGDESQERVGIGGHDADGVMSLDDDSWERDLDDDPLAPCARQRNSPASQSSQNANQTTAIKSNSSLITPRPSREKRPTPTKGKPTLSSWERTATFPPSGSPANGTSTLGKSSATLVGGTSATRAAAKAKGSPAGGTTVKGRGQGVAGTDIELDVLVDEIDWQKDLHLLDLSDFMEEDEGDEEQVDGMSAALPDHGLQQEEDGQAVEQGTGAGPAAEEQMQLRWRSEAAQAEPCRQQEQSQHPHPTYDDSFDVECFDDAILSQMPLPAAATPPPALVPPPAAAQASAVTRQSPASPSAYSHMQGAPEQPGAPVALPPVEAPPQASKAKARDPVAPANFYGPPKTNSTSKAQAAPGKGRIPSSPFGRSHSHGEVNEPVQRRATKRSREVATLAQPSGAGLEAIGQTAAPLGQQAASEREGNDDDDDLPDPRHLRRARTTSTSPTKRSGTAVSSITNPLAGVIAASANATRTASTPLPAKKRLGSAVALAGRSTSAGSRAPSPTNGFRPGATMGSASQQGRSSTTCRPAGLVRTSRTASGGVGLTQRQKVFSSSKATTRVGNEEAEAAMRDFLADEEAGYVT